MSAGPSIIEETQNNEDHGALYASSVYQLLCETEYCYCYINSLRQPRNLLWMNEETAQKRTLKWSPLLKCRIAQIIKSYLLFQTCTTPAAAEWRESTKRMKDNTSVTVTNGHDSRREPDSDAWRERKHSRNESQCWRDALHVSQKCITVRVIYFGTPVASKYYNANLRSTVSVTDA